MIKDFAKRLAAFKEFKDFIIVEITFRRGNFTSAAKILKNSVSRVILRATTTDAEILVKMIRPRTNFPPPNKKFHAENCWRTFSTEEILNFVAAVGDKNQIHPPIVPAFLILESICAELKPNFIKLRFKNFISAEESLTLQIDGNKLKISADCEKISGEFS